MNAFRFSPELFEHRSEVMETLERAGYCWLSHYNSVDCLHDLYGLEVCGIKDRDDALAISRVLVERFPGWISDVDYKDVGLEPGWKVKIHRDKPRKPERWETA